MKTYKVRLSTNSYEKFIFYLKIYQTKQKIPLSCLIIVIFVLEWTSERESLKKELTRKIDDADQRTRILDSI